VDEAARKNSGGSLSKPTAVTETGSSIGGLSDAPAPRVSIGLPVYNGERYLRESLDALLAQTFTDFELIISDNASTDSTATICEEYAARDDRIRYVRQPANIGAAANHNVVVSLARGSYFKWASHDDLYHPDLVGLCVAALDEHPEAVLAHSWDGLVDPQGDVVSAPPYPLDTANPSARDRLRSVLRTSGGNDIYGLVRIDVMRRVRRLQTYYGADRTFVAELALAGPFHQVPRVMYYRREHPDRASHGSRRARAAALGPARANRLRHPMARMYVEYVYDFARAVWAAPLSLRERLGCTVEIADWAWDAVKPGRWRSAERSPAS
jgi:glycosyltransferase involved in cell wall biosynthesis